MHFALLLAGLGTALLGPILPVLATEWHMKDSQSGVLMLTKFCGAFLGGVSVSRNLVRSLLVGLVSSLVGFGYFALAPDMVLGAAALFVAGFGIGQIITATNILAGRRFSVHRGSALSLLNFSFSLGAMLSALLAAWLLPKFSLRSLLEWFAAAFLVGVCGLLLELRGAQFDAGEATEPEGRGKIRQGLRTNVYVYFAVLLVLYGGLETCLSGWLTTFALRYGDKTLAVSEYTTLLLWLALTIGRAAGSAVMLRIGESTVQRWGLLLTAVFTAGLAFSHSAIAIGTFAALLGLSLAPFFPSTWALLISEGPTARQAGVVLAVSGLGAAALPWMMGVISTGAGSLQVALSLPLATAFALLVLSLLSKRRETPA